MNTFPANWLIPAGAIVAALVAGLFSFFNLVLSKEQKLSELRQEWINGLRDELAQYIAALNAIEYLNSVYRHQHSNNLNYVDLAKAIHEPYMQLSTSLSQILLRLNPGDTSKAQKELTNVLTESSKHFADQKYDDATNCVPKIREMGARVLKEEWERVKRGEPTFRWSKRMALLVLLAAVALGGFLAFQTRGLSSASTAPVKPEPSANNRLQSTPAGALEPGR